MTLGYFSFGFTTETTKIPNPSIPQGKSHFPKGNPRLLRPWKDSQTNIRNPHDLCTLQYDLCTLQKEKIVILYLSNFSKKSHTTEIFFLRKAVKNWYYMVGVKHFVFFIEGKWQRISKKFWQYLKEMVLKLWKKDQWVLWKKFSRLFLTLIFVTKMDIFP